MNPELPVVPEMNRLDELDPTHFDEDGDQTDAEGVIWPVYDEVKGG